MDGVVDVWFFLASKLKGGISQHLDVDRTTFATFGSNNFDYQETHTQQQAHIYLRRHYLHGR